MATEAQMRLAIVEARKAMGKTHPNPAVGAIIFHGGNPVASGHTQPVGGDHAEKGALKAFQKLGLQADATTIMVVTLEPCSTCGRTGACTDAIIDSGIRRVSVGAIDPNPDHSGKGFEVLRGAGIDVLTGILENECTDLNLIFNWQMQERKPFFAGKIATTIDGRIATRGGSSKWITGTKAREDVHRWRQYFPAIAVGAGTILADDPSLTVRVPDEPEFAPIRFIFDRKLITFQSGLPRVYKDQWKERTIVVTDKSQADRVKQLEALHGLNFWTLDGMDKDAGLGEFSDKCQFKGIHGVLVEGGAGLLSSFLTYRHLHYLFSYRAPKLLADVQGLAPFFGQQTASMDQAFELHSVRQATFGDDQLMRGFLVYPA